MDDKDPQAFRTISEAAEELDLPQHVLRFWESRFREIKPMKRGGGRRFYRPEDLDLLRGIKHLLYGEGYTIRGVQRILREQGIKFVQAVREEGAAQLEAADEGTSEERTGDTERFEQDEGIGMKLGSLVGRDLNVRPDGHRIEPTLSAAPQLGLALRAIPMDAPPQRAPTNGLSREYVETLQSVLDDLLACRHLIDDAVASTE